MTDDTDYHYALLMEGSLDLMHLPAGVVAWLWKHGRPETQADTAAMVGSIAYQSDDPVVDAGILRADQNILVLHTQSGLKINVYPDGGLGSDGQPLEADPASLQAFFTGGSMMAAPGMDPMGGALTGADLGMDMGSPMDSIDMIDVGL
jgi:hypothetical protein